MNFKLIKENSIPWVWLGSASLVVCLLLVFSQKKALAEIPLALDTPTGKIFGTLELPEPDPPEPVPVALLIAGSGPTDRDGNNFRMKNNSLKLLAESLKQSGIASLRYDKRGIGQSKSAGPKEVELRFEHFVEDAAAWVKLLDQDPRFERVIVIGHSEGSLIGMLAARHTNVSQFISLAGVGRSADQILYQQLQEGAPKLVSKAEPILAALKQGNTVKDVPLMLKPIFRQSIQHYMISWFKYTPSVVLSKLKQDVLIVQGTTDIQVSVAEARLLAAAQPQAQLKVIEGMNHIFKNAPLDRKKNVATYNQPNLPLHLELIPTILGFIHSYEDPMP